MRSKKHLLAVAAVLLSLCAGVSIAQTGIPFRLKQNHLSGVASNPVFITNAKDGTRRIFLLEQAGLIKVYQPGSTTPTTFLNITSRVLSGGERGLLGLAFHPQYSTNRRFFVYYTRQTDGAIQIAEYQASTADPNVADTTEKIIITISHPTNSNHNGGTVAFGPDGYLYAGPGDGGSGNDPPNNAQNINQLLGKMIRLDINNVPVGQVPQYNIPPTNPFVGVAGADEIYSVGMRNPYRFSFDRGGTNQLWAGDVGQGSWEEVDIITLGANYGWRVYEGLHCTGLDAGLCIPSNYTSPVFEYSSAELGRCSITGGYVYRGAQRAFESANYIYADYCTGEVFRWNGTTQTRLQDSPRNIVSFGEDEDGELYVVHAPSSGGTGAVDKVMGNKLSADFDGDLRADRAVYRSSNNTYYALNSSNGNFVVTPFGLPGDIATPEDYDGDGKVDVAVFRPSNSTWYYTRSTDGAFIVEQFGQTGDTPVTGDFDADGRSDLTVFRSTTGEWLSRRSKDNSFFTQTWGLAGDIPVAGDFDGDNRLDLTVWRPSNGNWYTINSTNGNFVITGWGLTNDIPSQGDFDGDGRADLAVFRPSTGEWFLRRSSNNTLQVQAWGLNGDIPVPGDYDGDMVDDLAVFRPSNGIWYVIGSTSGVNISQQWGLDGDSPVPRLDTP